MKTTEALVLAGGFGARLRQIVSDVPKPMADINGKPFLSYLLRRLSLANIRHVVISTGYMHEKIENFFGRSFENIRISYSQETEPLGTGGAIRFALHKIESADFFVLNGDTLFNINFERFENFYSTKGTMLAVALRKVDEANRYGSVNIDKSAKITGFNEKNTAVKGASLINGGVYLMNKKLFENRNLPAAFSFEKDILEKCYLEDEFFGMTFDSFFIDIGIPEDYARAQKEFSELNF